VVEVADTIGAGDAFTAGLIAGLIRRNAHSPSALAEPSFDLISSALDDAIEVSALTCERAGADPPRLDWFPR
jgi:fructokinase